IAATKVDLRDAVDAASERGASQGRSAVRGTRALVSAQVAFAVVLLVGAGLLLRTFVSLSRTNLGYTVDAHTLTFHVNLSGTRFRDAEARLALIGSLVTHTRALRGVSSVGYTAVSPWNGGLMNVGLRIEGRASDDASVPSIQYATASDDFFTAIGIPLRAGRVFSPLDRLGAPPVAVISESVARRFWPTTSPIGARVRL